MSEFCKKKSGSEYGILKVCDEIYGRQTEVIIKLILCNI